MYEAFLLIYEPIFEAFAAGGVRYLIVGGLATVLHGHIRMTADIDLIVHLEPDNCRKAIETLVALGFKPRAPVDPLDFADPVKRNEWVHTKGLTVFSMSGKSEVPVEIDLFVEEPMDFEELWQKRSELEFGGTVAQVIDKNSLIELKSRSGRPQDLEDIAGLKRLGDA
jgi:hypothetical protein